MSVSPSEHVRLRARTRIVADGDAILLALAQRRARITGLGECVYPFLHALADGGTTQLFASRLEQAGHAQLWPRLRPWLDALDDAGFIERVRSLELPNVAPPGRFDKFVDLLSEYESPEQPREALLERLLRSCVVLVGVGGLGSWISWNLACYGVGRLVLVDGDLVEATNLNRSISFRAAHVGMAKVDAARETLQAFAPTLELVGVRRRITCVEDLLPLLDGADLLIGAADQPPRTIREIIAQAGLQAGVPSLQASGFRVGPTFVPGHSSCPGCDWAQQLDRNPKLAAMRAAAARLPRGSSGGVAGIASITAGVVGMDALRVLVGQQAATCNAIWEMDADLCARLLPLPVHPGCQICQRGDASAR